MPVESIRFVVSPIFLPANVFCEIPSSSHVQSNPSPVKVWAALAVQGSRVLYRRAEGLSQLVQKLRRDVLENEPPKHHLRGFALWLKLWLTSHPRYQAQSKSIPTVLVVQPEEILRGHRQCLPNWSPDDIEAECWLEAASQLQLPMAQVAMDYEVELTAEGLWVAHFMASPQSLVKLYCAELRALDLQLETITCSSAIKELCEAWAFKPEVLSEVMRLPCQGELASDYFNGFEGHTTC